MTNTTATAADTITARVAILIASGMNPVDALKAVCGAKAVDAMIDGLYTELRAKGGR